MSRASSRNAEVSDWVNNSFFQEEAPAVRHRAGRIKGSFMDSSFDLRNGCEVKDFSDEDTVPAELLDLIKSIKL